MSTEAETTAPADRAKQAREEAQAEILAAALKTLAIAYGVPPRVSTQWAVAWGSENSTCASARPPERRP